MVGEPMFFYSVAKPIARDSKMDCSAADIPVVLAQCGKDVVAFDVSDSMVEVRGVDIRQYAFRHTFPSSLTLPGHEYDRRAVFASRDKRLGAGS
jgi:hypothetical protein